MKGVHPRIIKETRAASPVQPNLIEYHTSTLAGHYRLSFPSLFPEFWLFTTYLFICSIRCYILPEPTSSFLLYCEFPFSEFHCDLAVFIAFFRLKCGCVPFYEGYSAPLSGIRRWSGRALEFIYSGELNLKSLLA